MELNSLSNGDESRPYVKVAMFFLFVFNRFLVEFASSAKFSSSRKPLSKIKNLQTLNSVTKLSGTGDNEG